MERFKSLALLGGGALLGSLSTFFLLKLLQTQKSVTFSSSFHPFFPPHIIIVLSVCSDVDFAEIVYGNNVLRMLLLKLMVCILVTIMSQFLLIDSVFFLLWTYALHFCLELRFFLYQN
jgi:hypothetical protein